MADPHTTVVERAAANNRRLVQMPTLGQPMPPPEVHKAVLDRNFKGLVEATLQPRARRRDPSRPGHFLDDTAPAGLSPASQRVAPSATGVGSGQPISTQEPVISGPTTRVEPSAPAAKSAHPILGDIALPEAFLSASAFDALDSYIHAIVDARIAARTGGTDAKPAQDRLEQAKAQFAANFVQK